jgi:hypothetical protein
MLSCAKDRLNFDLEFELLSIEFTSIGIEHLITTVMTTIRNA